MSAKIKKRFRSSRRNGKVRCSKIALASTRKVDLLTQMPYRVCKTIDIESGHMLSKHPGKCKFPHGHTRKVEFILEAENLNRNEMVCDFLVVKELIGDYLETLDHSICVNTADPAYPELRARYGDRIIAFENEDPTTEVIARVVFQTFATKLAGESARQDKGYPVDREVRLVSVKVWETASSWAEYYLP